MPTPFLRFPSSEAGFVLIPVLLFTTLLFLANMMTLSVNGTDLRTTRNRHSGIETLWIARAGTEIGKNWLEHHLLTISLPVILGPTPLGSGTYTVEIVAIENNAYRVTAIARGPEGSRQDVEEIVRLPNLPPLGVILNEGDGLHPDFDDLSGGTGRRIPDFSIDGRNHTPDGVLSSTCPAIAPYAVTRSAAQEDLSTALATLKRELVARANAYCQADGGSSGGGICTPGLSWIRGSTTLPRFMSGACVAIDPSCFVNLDLSAAALRATAQPPEEHLLPPPQDRGPFVPTVSTTLPFARLLTASEQSTVHAELDELIRRIGEIPGEKTLTIATSIASGTHIYGTPENPRLTVIEDGTGALDISGGAVLNGAGILLIPRVLQVREATVNWHGLVVIVGDGDLRASDPAVCGQIVGAVVIRDDAAVDRKLDFDVIRHTGSCNRFAVNYSCEAIARALALLMRTDSRMEKFDG
jgi:hypothetical protein